MHDLQNVFWCKGGCTANMIQHSEVTVSTEQGIRNVIVIQTVPNPSDNPSSKKTLCFCPFVSAVSQSIAASIKEK